MDVECPRTAAIEFAQRTGMRVHPVAGKAPITQWGTDTGSSTDPAVIQQMPWDNADWFGVTLDGHTVIDIDDWNAANPWISAIDAEPTYAVMTPRGGVHVFFTGEVKAHKRPGADVKSGRGHQVVGPGAPGRQPLTREWRVAPVPAAVVSTPAGPVAVPLGDKFRPGERNDGLAKLLGRVYRMSSGVLTPDELQYLALVLNRTRCDPPLSDDEVMQTVGRFKENWAIAGPATEPPAWLGKPGLPNDIGDWDTIARQPKIEASVLGLFYPTELNWVYGRPGIGKSWVAQLAAADAGKLGHPVVWLDAESSAKVFVDRYSMMGMRWPDNVNWVGVQDRERLDDAIAQIAGSGVKAMVVIDSAEASGCGQSADEFWEWHKTTIMPLRTASCGIIVVDHVSKHTGMDGYRARGAIGTQAKLGAVSGSAVFLSGEGWAPGRSGALTGQVDKDRHGGVPSDIWRVQGSVGDDTVSITIEPGERDGASTGELVAIRFALSDISQTVTDITAARGAQRNGESTRRTIQLLEQLEQAGEAVRDGRRWRRA